MERDVVKMKVYLYCKKDNIIKDVINWREKYEFITNFIQKLIIKLYFDKFI